jgi:hypothetical protein
MDIRARIKNSEAWDASQKGLSFQPEQHSIKDVMQMDPLTLAAIAAPFVAKGAETFSKSAGDKLGAKVGELCQAVINKFKSDSDAEETLALAQKKPDSKGRQSALEEVLAEKLEADPDFAEKLQKLVDEVQKGGTKTTFDQRGQTVHGAHTNIAGNVSGPVLSGTFSGPVNTDKSR